MTDAKKEKDIDFKAGIERLEEIVESLESGEVDLEDALKAFEEGIKISRKLSEKLDKAEKQIRELVEQSDGTLTTEVMEEIEEE